MINMTEHYSSSVKFRVNRCTVRVAGVTVRGLGCEA